MSSKAVVVVSTHTTITEAIHVIAQYAPYEVVCRGPYKDGVLRHLANGQAWQSFDNLHPKFSANNKNVRLGLCSDGFNPFRNISTSHSTWPVMIVPYNLLP
jgi:hypothetical protein